MKRLMQICLCVVVLIALPGLALAGGGDASLFIGMKTLENDWSDFDNDIDLEGHDEFGAVLNFNVKEWPVAIAVDVLMSEESDSYFDYYDDLYEYKAETMEVAIGVRKFFRDGEIFQPYIGGGAAYINAEISVYSEFFDESFSEDDNGFGYWANVGARFAFGSRFIIGVDVRYSDADVEYDDGDGGFKVGAGGVHYGALVGFRWGD